VSCTPRWVYPLLQLHSLNAIGIIPWHNWCGDRDKRLRCSFGDDLLQSLPRLAVVIAATDRSIIGECLHALGPYTRITQRSTRPPEFSSVYGRRSIRSRYSTSRGLTRHGSSHGPSCYTLYNSHHTDGVARNCVLNNLICICAYQGNGPARVIPMANDLFKCNSFLGKKTNHLFYSMVGNIAVIQKLV